MNGPILYKRNTSEKIVKKFLLAAAFTSVFSVGAIAQSSPPRDPPYGKGNADNDSMHLPSGTGNAHSSNQNPPRDPPYGKGNADNDTTHLPSGTGNTHSSNQNPPRDPPYGKGGM